MFKKIVLVLLVLIVIFLAVVWFQPATFHVERSATIAAPAPVVFAQVNDFHNWKNWSPWEKLDPDMKRTLEGPEAGVGAKYSWVGNKEVGEGHMTILESKPNEYIKIKLEFIKPFEATSTTEFTFKAKGDDTDVNWAMHGENNFIAKGFHLFMNMDKMIGGDFEKGLANLNTVAAKKEEQKAN